MDAAPRTFGEALTDLMLKRGIVEDTELERKMAEKGLKMNAQTIGYHRNDALGPRGPRTETLRRYCKFFEVAPDYFAPFLAHLARPVVPARSTVRPRWVNSLQEDNTDSEELKRTTLAVEVARVPFSEKELSILFFVRRAERHWPGSADHIEAVAMKTAMEGPPKSQLRSGGDRGE